MRPATQYQAMQHMHHLLSRKLAGNRQTRVKEHTRRAMLIAAIIWQRFQVGPYRYQVKHLRWYLDTQTRHLKPATRYRHWLTIKNLVSALGKEKGWSGQLRGAWMSPVTEE